MRNSLIKRLSIVLMLGAVCHVSLAEVRILDTQALKYIDSNTKLKTLASGFKWTEGPLWLQDKNQLLFSDIPNNRIMSFSPESGVNIYLEPSGATRISADDSAQGSNGLLMTPKGDLLLLQQGDRRIATMNAAIDNPLPKFNTLVAMYEGKRLNSPNDGVYDSEGNLYFTDPPYGLNRGIEDENKALAFQGVFVLLANGETILLDDQLSFPNGIGLSPDEKTLYVAVSDPEHSVWYAYTVKGAGKVAQKRVLLDVTQTVKEGKLSGYPDGMAVHRDGTLFASGPGGIWLIDPKGKVLAHILTGKHTANCTFSDDQRTLYIAAHDRLMSIKLKP